MDTFSGHVAKKVAIYTEALAAAKIDSVIIYAGDLVSMTTLTILFVAIRILQSGYRCRTSPGA